MMMGQNLNKKMILIQLFTFSLKICALIESQCVSENPANECLDSTQFI